MKEYLVRTILVLLAIAISGCSSAFVATGGEVAEVAEISESQSDSAEAVDVADTTSSIQKYEQEEAVLAQILAYYDRIQVAHREGDFGLAETLIDSAFISFGQVNTDEILDQELATRFMLASGGLAREYGMILMESAQIAQEDPEVWIPDLSNAEQFKSGQWSDEELRTIVNKIAQKCDVPIDYNDKVRNSISYFQNNGRKVMTNWLRRSGRYMPLIQATFTEEGLPLDLGYLCMIESGLNPRATSPARAVGLWQFIYTTGKLYGLERNEWYDERRDPVKSTRAAAQHLRDLFKIYDDWNLVLAAYNCGPGRISRTVQSSGISDYWRINLPRETSNYVPTFMAAVIIAKAPELFGFDKIEKDAPFEYDTVEVRPYTSLKDAARCANADVDDLRTLNCELLGDYTPGGRENYSLRIPRGRSDDFLAAYSLIPETKQPVRETVTTASASTPAKVHRVRSGETLSKIARKYGVTVSSLMKANKLKKSSRLKAGRKLVIPGRGGTVEVAERSSSRSVDNSRAEKTTAQKSSGVTGETVKYKVRKSDTLWSIANRHNTTVDALVAINNLGDSSNLRAGQVIRVPRDGAGDSGEPVTRKTAAKSRKSSDTVTYVVRKNDSLFDIANKYGVSYKDIMVWNKIKSPKKIKPGDRLVIKTKG